ncbi:hypothetical protein NPIL_208231 [Nephila pilipes]|uniref:Uncharacterized protein n=1 Tax=Nephila pilipes TaxID=299642 RepID=A0A8X6TK37_NEPPI|nr:hypothetical protein NPIL_208231 [Nephila pilipes]
MTSHMDARGTMVASNERGFMGRLHGGIERFFSPTLFLSVKLSSAMEDVVEHVGHFLCFPSAGKRHFCIASGWGAMSLKWTIAYFHDIKLNHSTPPKRPYLEILTTSFDTAGPTDQMAAG